MRVMCLYFSRIGAGDADSAATSHHQPASHYSGLTHISLNNSNINTTVLTEYMQSCEIEFSKDSMQSCKKQSIPHDSIAFNTNNLK